MDLFTPAAFGDLQLANRVVMAPLTRLRSSESGVPGPLVVEYYAQRAGFGLIVSEGVWPVQEGKAYPGQPGIETDEQVEAWQLVTAAVHARGGQIVLQLMHGGRVSHTEITGTDRIVGPSAVAIDGEAHTPVGKKAFPVPHALSTDELSEVRDQLVLAARNAIRAGFDGVEVHSANGYLLHEFLSPVSNARDDQYGGSPENRARFVIEVTKAIREAIGAGRTGIRISPAHNIQGIAEVDEADVHATYGVLMDALEPLGLAYVSILRADLDSELVRDLHERFGGAYIVNSGFSEITTRDEAIHLVEATHADAVAIGRLAIANPDLVERWESEAEVNEPNPATFYGAGAEGYTDYPVLESSRA
ncbi:2,4-dienoyl-CoA reductase-like NADH-dependent reductase (Old Yellow Enzyme family) [Frondihabitans sp. PhB188]|uniref:alkene reductase n=1 Tax=Frondihabitans sp. PhB188 TaxID=2485200 RepID=UPI000F4AB9E5|nr:alkene reductase [Frondihabitans sp. PhB188]ROQ37263.1 2,4-dienoyl-CoA reductase-like NADH-dependent reductase (Old Yellow Enzyme family) [Frondihabitans sp. PhB188]